MSKEKRRGNREQKKPKKNKVQGAIATSAPSGAPKGSPTVVSTSELFRKSKT